MEIEENSKSKSDSTRSSSSCSGLQWSEWQLLDSILPTGGFAHSLGLEAAMQSRLISGEQNLQFFILQLLENTGSLLLPFVLAAAESPNAQTLRRLDRILDATLTNEVARGASTAQGSALMRVAAAVFPETGAAAVKRSAAGSSYHHAPAFGLLCGLVGVGPETAQRAYLYLAMRDAMSAATRLGLVGPMGAAVLQHRMAGAAEAAALRWMGRDVDEACQVAPLLDTVQGCHAYLFSRLFCS